MVLIFAGLHILEICKYQELPYVILKCCNVVGICQLYNIFLLNNLFDNFLLICTTIVETCQKRLIDSHLSETIDVTA